jgi:hypothetical protein
MCNYAITIRVLCTALPVDHNYYLFALEIRTALLFVSTQRRSRATVDPTLLRSRVVPGTCAQIMHATNVRAQIGNFLET